MRNSIIVAIFVGGAALQAATQILTFGEQYTFLPSRPETYPSTPLLVRAGVISTLLIMSFLNWAMVIRYNNHAGFMVGAIDIQMRMLENQVELEEEEEEGMEMEMKEGKEQEQGEERGGLGMHVSLANCGGVDIDEEGKEEGEGEGKGVGLNTTGIPSCRPLRGARARRRTHVAVPASADSAGSIGDSTPLLDEPEAVTSLKRVMRLVALHFAWGFRCIFMSIPFFFYHVGLIPLIVSAIVMLIFIWYFDAPSMAVPESRYMQKRPRQTWGAHADTAALRKPMANSLFEWN